MNLKEYPKVDWKELPEHYKVLFDKIENIIRWNKEVLEWTEVENNFDAIAYNSAFWIIMDEDINIWLMDYAKR